MTTATIKFGWNGISNPEKAREENKKTTKRVNRVLSKLGKPTVSNVGGECLELCYEMGRNLNLRYIVDEFDCRDLTGETVREVETRLVEELSENG